MVLEWMVSAPMPETVSWLGFQRVKGCWFGKCRRIFVCVHVCVWKVSMSNTRMEIWDEFASLSGFGATSCLERIVWVIVFLFFYFFFRHVIINILLDFLYNSTHVRIQIGWTHSHHTFILHMTHSQSIVSKLHGIEINSWGKFNGRG